MEVAYDMCKRISDLELLSLECLSTYRALLAIQIAQARAWGQYLENEEDIFREHHEDPEDSEEYEGLKYLLIEQKCADYAWQGKNTDRLVGR